MLSAEIWPLRHYSPLSGPFRGNFRYRLDIIFRTVEKACQTREDKASQLPVFAGSPKDWNYTGIPRRHV